MSYRDYLKPDAKYMNPHTGSVDTGSNWLNAFHANWRENACLCKKYRTRKAAFKGDGWESLIEVIDDGEGNWVKVE